MRDINAALEAHLAGQVVRVIRIVFLDFAGDAGFYHSDLGTIRLDLGLPSPNNGMQDYIGVGQLGEIEGIDEDSDLAPDSYTLSLNGADSTLIAHARSMNHLGREGRIWLGARDLVTGAIVGTPEPLVRGEMDSMTVQGGEEGAIILELVDERTLLQRTAGVLFSHAQQQSRHTGDGFFRQAARAAERTVFLGPGETPVNAGGGGGGGGNYRDTEFDERRFR